MDNSIGFKIKKLREQKEISQEDLAFQLEVSQSYLSKLKTGPLKNWISFLCRRFPIFLRWNRSIF